MALPNQKQRTLAWTLMGNFLTGAAIVISVLISAAPQAQASGPKCTPATPIFKSPSSVWTEPEQIQRWLSEIERGFWPDATLRKFEGSVQVSNDRVRQIEDLARSYDLKNKPVPGSWNQLRDHLQQKVKEYDLRLRPVKRGSDLYYKVRQAQRVYQAFLAAMVAPQKDRLAQRLWIYKQRGSIPKGRLIEVLDEYFRARSEIEASGRGGYSAKVVILLLESFAREIAFLKQQMPNHEIWNHLNFTIVGSVVNGMAKLKKSDLDILVNLYMGSDQVRLFLDQLSTAVSINFNQSLKNEGIEGAIKEEDFSWIERSGLDPFFLKLSPLAISYVKGDFSLVFKTETGVEERLNIRITDLLEEEPIMTLKPASNH